MSSLHWLALGIAGLGLAQLVSPQTQVCPTENFAAQRVDFERDLELVARIAGATPVHAWWPLSITVDIVNRSASTSYPIVRPGDGSSDGRREPLAYFTAEVLARDGTWSAVPSRGGLSCGNYDPYWLDEIDRLAPGSARRLLNWTRAPDLPDQGLVRLRAHYAYRAQPSGPQWGDRDSARQLGFGDMECVEPFELVSEPIEFVVEPPESTRGEIERDLALELVRDGAGLAHSWELVRFHARLTNTSATQSHHVVQPSFARKSGCHEPRISEFVRIDRGGAEWQTANKLMGGFYDGPFGGSFERFDQVDWRTQVIELRPGQSIDFGLPADVVLHDFREARTAAMTIEYAYNGQAVRDANDQPAAAPASLGAMSAVPPFRLRSNEITWPVSSPLRLDVVPRADRDPSRAASLSDRVRIVLRNESDEELDISTPERAAKLGISAPRLVLGEHEFDVSGTLTVGRLVVPARSELSLLEDPAVDARSLSVNARSPDGSSTYEPGRIDVHLHRPGWLHSFSAVHKFVTK